MFGVEWKNNTTEATGCTLFIFCEETAQKLCDLANRDNTDYFHWVEEQEPEA